MLFKPLMLLWFDKKTYGILPCTEYWHYIVLWFEEKYIFFHKKNIVYYDSGTLKMQERNKDQSLSFMI